MKENNITESIKVSSSILKKVRTHVKKTKQTIGGLYDLGALAMIKSGKADGTYSWFKNNKGEFIVVYTEGGSQTFISKSDSAEKADFLSKAANQFDIDVFEFTEKLKK